MFSSTKNVTALAALILMDRGLIDPFTPVARYWPEFATNGKQDIEVAPRPVSHLGGVRLGNPRSRFDDLYDWEVSTSRLAGQAPWWPPGSASGYHCTDPGPPRSAEIVRRITGKTLKQFVREEIAEPLDADFQIGARPQDDRRASPS